MSSFIYQFLPIYNKVSWLCIFILTAITINNSLSLSSNALAQNTPLAEISILNDKLKSVGNLGKYIKAIKYYDKILKIAPINMDALTGMVLYCIILVITLDL
jgi:hypothetical protein